MKAASKILRITEDEARKLRLRLEKGEKLKFEDTKILLKALGLFAGDPELQEEAGKKSILWVAGLASFSAMMRKL